MAKTSADEGIVETPKQETTDQVAVFFGLALFLCCLPVYLYSTVYQLSLEEFGIVYLPVTVLSAFLLTLAHRTVASATFAHKMRSTKKTGVNHKKLGLTKEEVYAVQEQITQRESMAWALLFNNSAFLLFFLFLAFYALGLFGAAYQYAGSMLIASGATWQLASSVYKKK